MRHRQLGIAVVTALLLTTLAVTIVASLFWEQQIQVRSIENQRLQMQKQWILRGALDWASLILREDAKHSSVDNLDEPWAVPLAETRLDQYVENGRAGDNISDATLAGSIEDAQARYNLTNLCVNGIIDPAEVAVFGRLLDSLHLNPKLAQATADVMAAVQQAREMAPVAANGGSAAQPMNLTQIEDLLAVPGFSPEVFDKLKNLAIFLPRVTPVNVNTAPVEVLAARIGTLSLSDAAALVTMRNSASFRDLADLLQRWHGKPFTISAKEASVTSDYFLVDGRVRVNRARLDMQALIERNGGNTRIIWILEH